MNKDAVLASVIGFGIGLLITGGILFGPRLIGSLKEKFASKGGQVASANTNKQGATPTSLPSNTFTIDSPQAETIATSGTITVSGKATPGSMVLLAGDVEETALEASPDGSYSGTLSLKEGKNDIIVSNSVNGKETLKKITVYLPPGS